MTFKACKYLSFDESKYNCDLVRIGNHLGWERFDITGKLSLCQQCSKIGRLNNPEACIGKKNAMCTDYEEVNFEV